ncbi:MAG: hypothetical protein SNJ70_07475 [Armatimonadota bacterium]
MNKIIHITNFTRKDVVDGGTNREDALSNFLVKKRSENILVCNNNFKSNFLGKLKRPSEIINEISYKQPDFVVLNYPSYPFYWQHKVTIFYMLSNIFSRKLKKASEKYAFDIIIDIMDLPAFQYNDLGFKLEMNPKTLMKFDKKIFSNSNYLWVCSKNLSNLIMDKYSIENYKIIIALNGYSKEAVSKKKPISDVLKFAYAGSLNKERGIKELIESFLSADRQNIELHICGLYGEWIREEYDDRRIIYYGSKTNDGASNILSKCDIGLIPYPQSGYYQLAFATKLPFYLSLGTPILCSNVDETGSYIKKYNFGMTWDINDFTSAFSYITDNKDIIDNWKNSVFENRHIFSWDNIYSSALLETIKRARREMGSFYG